MTGRVGVCPENGGANRSSAVHVVKETLVIDRGQHLRTLNLVMMDSYLYDNVDYFYVVYDVVKPTDISASFDFDKDLVLPIR